MSASEPSTSIRSGGSASAQALLFPMPVEPPADRYDPVDRDEAAVLGRAVLAQLRGEPLDDRQRAALALAGAPNERSPEPVVDQSDVLLTLARGGEAELRVSLRRYRGSSPFLDLRRWEKDRTGRFVPTRDGVVVRLRELPALLGAVRDAIVRAKRGDAA